ncbi:CES5A.2 family protein [Megaselia abdita]
MILAVMGVLTVILIVFSNVPSIFTNKPMVSLPGQGDVMGSLTETAWTHQKVQQFLGIPYAESPSGKLRFKPPIPRAPWTSPLKATKYSLRCPEKLTLSKENIDLEDCLSLCVYTKDVHGKLPIMFYIYGGGFANGTAQEFPPGYLLEKDIVLIVTQYRVGALGWLSTRSEDIPGNVAFMDIILALKWVQKYASHFGGDPSQVTIFAQSGGAIITGLLTLSPNVPDNLYHRLILQSASVLMLDAEKEPIKLANQFCQRAQCSCSNIEEINSCLMNLSVSTLLEISSDNQYVMSVDDFHGYVPKQPNEMDPRPSIRNIEIMSGVTKQEGSFLLALIFDAIRHTITNTTTTNDIFNILYEQLKFKDPQGLLKPMLTKSIFHQSNELRSNDLKASIPGFIEVCNYFMKFPIYTLMQKYSHFNSKQTIYLYTFDYMGEHTRFGYEFGNEWYPFNGGVHHSDDNIYLFSTHKLNENDRTIAKKKVDLWTSFAANGTPSFDGVEMPRFDGMDGPYFKIDKEITFGSDFRDEFFSTVDDPDREEKFIRKNVCFGVC